VKKKLEAVQYMRTTGNSIRKTARKFNVNESMVRRWKKGEPALKGVVEDQVQVITKVRKLGAGRPSFFPIIEARLARAIEERNKLGVRVKDKHITLLAQHEKADFIALL
jgi:transposase-like protein